MRTAFLVLLSYLSMISSALAFGGGGQWHTPPGGAGTPEPLTIALLTAGAGVVLLKKAFKKH